MQMLTNQYGTLAEWSKALSSRISLHAKSMFLNLERGVSSTLTGIITNQYFLNSLLLWFYPKNTVIFLFLLLITFFSAYLNI